MSKFHAVKDSDFVNDVCALAKNTPRLVFPKHNNKRFMIREVTTNETLYVVFKLDNEERALIGHECFNPKENGSEPHKTDLMCVYSKPTHTIGYAYELKKTLGGKDVVLGLLSQWTDTVSYCKTISTKNDYKFVVGVITEEYNKDLLTNSISKLRDRMNDHDGGDFVRSSIERKGIVTSVNDRNILKRLVDFQNGKAEIQGMMLDIDIHYFDCIDDTKELSIQFNGDGKPQDLRFAIHMS